MPENFLISASNASSNASNAVAGAMAHDPVPDRESLRILVIGSRQGVTGTIQTLHRLRFAEVREWSPLLPGPNSGEVMSILARSIVLHGD